MAFELWMIAASVVLLFVQIGIQAGLLTRQLGSDYNAGPRDQDRPLSGKAARAKRMLANYLETYPAFIALALAAVVAAQTDWLTSAGGALYLLARIVYIPLYLQGIKYVRSAAYAIACLGLLAMLIGLLV